MTWPRPATALSLFGHALFLALLAIEAPRPMTATKQPLTAVDVIMVAPPESPPPTAEAAPSPPKIDSQPPTPRVARRSGGTGVTATEYYADAVLGHPRNKETRQRLAALGSDERLIQLCNIEAIEQLRHWKAGFVPDHVVVYATADPSMTATSLKAPGAAVHAGGKWYRLSFNCAATAKLDRVASFDFRLGRPIPYAEWEQDNLPEQVDGDPTD